MRRCLVIALICLCMVACGVTAPTRDEGYAEFDSLGFRDVEQTMALSLGPTVLKLAAMGVEDDPRLSQLLRNLHGVRVKTYNVIGDVKSVGDRVDSMSDKLREQGWVPVIWVREPLERTVVLIRVRADQIVGLAVVNSDEREAVLVNVMGELAPGMFSATMAGLDVDAPHIGVDVVEAPHACPENGPFPDNGPGQPL